jgi:deoxyadenosine/deoxycytidine kinase
MVQKRLLTIDKLNLFKEGLIILDRWVEEDCLFPANLYKSKIADEKRYKIYKKLFEILIKKAPKMDCFIFLKNSPETCFKNLKTRSNQSESKIPLDYLKSLGGLYEKFEKYMKSKYDSKFIVIKNNPFINVNQILDIIVKQINK